MTKYYQFFLKQILPILITAIISAIITALQAVLSHITNKEVIEHSMTTSATIGASLKTGHQFFKC